MEVKLIGIDTSKHVFTLHGVDEYDRAVLRRDLTRAQLEKFFRGLAPTEVAMEACGASHHWGRLLQGLGHRVRLVPAQYVKPYVKRGKSDRIDAAAICEAALRPGMRFVPVRTADRQAEAMLLRVRELLVRQQTQASNALRGHAAEFGVVVGRGLAQLEALEAEIERAEMPAPAREGLALLSGHVAELGQQLAEVDGRLLARHEANAVSQRLLGVPGIGPITALTLAMGVEVERFESGRHFAAWIGLTPRECSTGGKPRLGGISKQGHARLRQLLVVGAMSVIRFAKPGSKSASAWLLQLLERKPRKLAAVALANKMARIAWAMMTSGESYRRKPAAG